MSHECPECGIDCMCNGDIDDCCHNLPEDQDKCVHWKECEEYDDDEDWDESEAVL